MAVSAAAGRSLCVIVCTRERPRLLRATLAALGHQSDRDFEILLVEQGEPVDEDVAQWIGADVPLRVINDDGVGLSRARNLGWRATEAPWIAFVDDDCMLESDWVANLKTLIRLHPECAFISGEVTPVGAPPKPYVPAAVRRVRRQARLQGRWRPPLSLGHGVCMAVRRNVIEALGGWDERLGAGSGQFPAADDIDFNFRLLQRGELALRSPSLRAGHRQWRRPDELAALFRGYHTGRGGAAAKHMSIGDRTGGAWLLSLAITDCLILMASAVAYRSRLRLTLAMASAGGLIEGVRRGRRIRW